MPNTTQPVTYQNASSVLSTEVDVVLEQTVGTRLRYPTSVELVKLTAHLVFGVPGTTQVACGVDEETGEFVGDGLTAWTATVSTQYRIGLTNGRLTGGTVSVEHIEELVSFNFSNAGTIRYPTSYVISTEWATGPWDQDGKDVYGVTLNASQRNVVASKAVYGTALVKYISYKHVRNMFVDSHLDTDSNVYECYAWAAWDGGTTLMKVDPPSGLELRNFDDSQCYNTSTHRGGDTDIGDDDGGDGGERPEGYPEDYTIEYDYCTGEVLD